VGSIMGQLVLVRHGTEYKHSSHVRSANAVHFSYVTQYTGSQSANETVSVE
jgi:hypothetical protein